MSVGNNQFSRVEGKRPQPRGTGEELDHLGFPIKTCVPNVGACESLCPQCIAMTPEGMHQQGTDAVSKVAFQPFIFYTKGLCEVIFQLRNASYKVKLFLLIVGA